MKLVKSQNMTLKESPSQASLSTRVSSQGSLFESGEDEDEISAVAAPQKSETALFAALRARGRPVLLLLLAVASAWLLARRARRWTRSSSKFGSGRIALLLSAGLCSACRLLGITGWTQVRQPGAVPDRQVMAVMQPHGCYLLGGLVNHAKEPRNRQSPFYGVFIVGADVLFRLPFVREYALMMNTRPATKENIDVLLAAGKSIGICPGGIHEQLATDPSRERLFFAPNLGFVRQAIKHGVPLMPIYTFGENQLFDIPQWSRAISKVLYKRFGIGLPLAVGPWGLPFFPKSVNLQSYAGSIVEVGPADEHPSDERVREVFLAYCAELHRLFEARKGALPAAVAARGLELVWRGHEHEELSPRLASGLANIGAEDVESTPLSPTAAISEAKSGDVTSDAAKMSALGRSRL